MFDVYMFVGYVGYVLCLVCTCMWGYTSRVCDLIVSTCSLHTFESQIINIEFVLSQIVLIGILCLCTCPDKTYKGVWPNTEI